MDPLHVYPKTKQIKTASKVLFWVFATLFCGVVWLLIFEKPHPVQEETGLADALETFVAIIVGAWFLFYAIVECRRLHQLSELEGPLLTFTPEGVTDHLYSNRELRWDEIKFAGCRKYKEDGNHTNNYFILRPLNLSLTYRVFCLFRRPMKYNVHRLNIPTSDKPRSTGAYTYKHINKYIKDHAPKAYRRKRPREWPPYVSWLFIVAALVWGLKGRIW